MPKNKTLTPEKGSSEARRSEDEEMSASGVLLDNAVSAAQCFAEKTDHRKISKKQLLWGISLIVFSYICGFGSIAAGTYFLASKGRVHWSLPVLWLFSWLPFVAGLIMTGGQGLKLIRKKRHSNTNVT